MKLVYDSFSVLSIAAIKELKAQKDAEIDVLKAKNAELERKYVSLLERVEALEKK